MTTKYIKQAAQAIKNGKLVVFPTETVYGIGANALDAQAVLQIFAAKGRPADNPLIVHIANLKQLSQITQGELCEIERGLIERFWPGPLTLILPKAADVPDAVTAGLTTVAVRMPDHEVAQNLILEAGTPVAAPSANISGRPSPTSDQDLDPRLLEKVEVVIPAGKTKFGLESTVVQVKEEKIHILRPGAITEEDLLEIAPVFIPNPDTSTSPASPGMKYRHYAPDSKLILFEYDDQNHFITKMQEYLREHNSSRIGVICAEEFIYQFPEAGRVVSLGHLKSPPTIASSLFQVLNSLDAFKQEVFLVHGVPEQGLGKAIMNRMRKAVGKN